VWVAGSLEGTATAKISAGVTAIEAGDESGGEASLEGVVGLFESAARMYAAAGVVSLAIEVCLKHAWFLAWRGESHAAVQVVVEAMAWVEEGRVGVAEGILAWCGAAAVCGAVGYHRRRAFCLARAAAHSARLFRWQSARTLYTACSEALGLIPQQQQQQQQQQQVTVAGTDAAADVAGVDASVNVGGGGEEEGGAASRAGRVLLSPPPQRLPSSALVSPLSPLSHAASQSASRTPTAGLSSLHPSHALQIHILADAAASAFHAGARLEAAACLVQAVTRALADGADGRTRAQLPPLTHTLSLATPPGALPTPHALLPHGIPYTVRLTPRALEPPVIPRADESTDGKKTGQLNAAGWRRTADGSPFIVRSFGRGRKKQRARPRVVWQCGATVMVGCLLWNPLPVALPLQAIALRFGGSAQVVAHTSSVTLPPAGETEVVLTGEVRGAGRVVIEGVTIQAFNFLGHHDVDRHGWGLVYAAEHASALRARKRRLASTDPDAAAAAGGGGGGGGDENDDGGDDAAGESAAALTSGVALMAVKTLPEVRVTLAGGESGQGTMQMVAGERRSLTLRLAADGHTRVHGVALSVTPLASSVAHAQRTVARQTTIITLSTPTDSVPVRDVFQWSLPRETLTRVCREGIDAGGVLEVPCEVYGAVGTSGFEIVVDYWGADPKWQHRCRVPLRVSVQQSLQARAFSVLLPPPHMSLYPGRVILSSMSASPERTDGDEAEGQQAHATAPDATTQQQQSQQQQRASGQPDVFLLGFDIVNSTPHTFQVSLSVHTDLAALASLAAEPTTDNDRSGNETRVATHGLDLALASDVLHADDTHTPVTFHAEASSTRRVLVCLPRFTLPSALLKSSFPGASWAEKRFGRSPLGSTMTDEMSARMRTHQWLKLALERLVYVRWGSTLGQRGHLSLKALTLTPLMCRMMKPPAVVLQWTRVCGEGSGGETTTTELNALDPAGLQAHGVCGQWLDLTVTCRGSLLSSVSDTDSSVSLRLVVYKEEAGEVFHARWDVSDLLICEGTSDVVLTQSDVAQSDGTCEWTWRVWPLATGRYVAAVAAVMETPTPQDNSDDVSGAAAARRITPLARAAAAAAAEAAGAGRVGSGGGTERARLEMPGAVASAALRRKRLDERTVWTASPLYVNVGLDEEEAGGGEGGGGA
jgi:hypothetical protein